MIMANCSVCHTSAGSYQNREEGISFHRFPSTNRAVICSKWKKFAGLAEDADVKYKRICSRHFRAEEFIRKSPFRKNLLCGAVPTLLHPSQHIHPSDSETVHTSAPSLEDVLSSSEDSSKNDCTLHPALADASESNDSFDSHADYSKKNNNEDLSSRLLLDDVRKELCRLCGQKGAILAPIFVVPSLSEDDPVPLKIEMHLPFKVKEEDPLPTHICLNCSDILNRWHELYVTCVAANAVLWKTFAGEINEETSNDVDNAVISVKEDFKENEASLNNEVEAEIKQMPTVPLISEEAQENTDIIYAECKKFKTEIEPTEETVLDEEFDKNFVTVRDYSYKCRFCYELFKNSEDRKNHLAMCRQLSTICEMCGHKVLCRKDLRRHINLKHLKQVNHRYICDKCGKCFKSQSGLKHHKIRHVNPLIKTSPKFYCVLCCTAFLNEKSFHIHQERHAEGKIKPLFQTKTCREGEDSEDAVSVSVFTCPVCQEVFNDMLSLVVHMTTKKQMKCESCRKSISCEKRLLLHVCGEWTCKYCPKTFKNKQKCTAHERIHTGEKPIKCRICDKMFRTWPARKLHENRHNPSVFECSYCGKKFTNKYKFQDHVACHEGKEFVCYICNKNFSGRKNLQKHKKHFHKNAEESS